MSKTPETIAIAVLSFLLGGLAASVFFHSAVERETTRHITTNSEHIRVLSGQVLELAKIVTDLVEKQP